MPPKNPLDKISQQELCTTLRRGESLVLPPVEVKEPNTGYNTYREVATITVGGIDLRVVDLRCANPTHLVKDIPVIEVDGVLVRSVPEMPFAVIGASISGGNTARGIWVGRDTVIGRGDPRLNLTNDRISRRHCALRIGMRGELVVTDFSKNGTYVKVTAQDNMAGGWGNVLGKPYGALDKFPERTKLLATPLDTNSKGKPIGEVVADEKIDYENLWEMSDGQSALQTEEYLRKTSEERTARRHRVTEESIKDSRNALEKAIGDSRLAGIINEYARSEDIIDELRLNHPLRCAVVGYFQQKLNKIRESAPSSLPERTKWDDPNKLKAPGFEGYPVDEMTSSEYVALLALSMIDGSFDHSRADTEQSSAVDGGPPAFGQHRYTAKIVLFGRAK